MLADENFNIVSPIENRNIGFLKVQAITIHKLKKKNVFKSAILSHPLCDDSLK